MTEFVALTVLFNSTLASRHIPAFSRHVLPELCVRLTPSGNRGRREDRVPTGTRGPLCENCATRGCTAAYRWSQTSGLPCAVALRLMSRSPRGAMHYCPRRLASDRKTWRQPAGARTTRFCRTRDRARRARETMSRATQPASTAAHPAFRDDRDTPLWEGWGGGWIRQFRISV